MPASLQLLCHQKKIITLQTVQPCFRKLCIVVTEIGALLLPKSEHSRLPKSVHFSLPFTQAEGHLLLQFHEAAVGGEDGEQVPHVTADVFQVEVLEAG